MEMTEFANKSYKEFLRQVDASFEKALRENAEPPITGEITKEEIDARGIRMIHRGGIPSHSWLEQNGKRISPIITIGAELNINGHKSFIEQ
jgi:hypothetical protein